MVETISILVVTLAGFYGFAGVLVAFPFVWRGAGRLDPAAGGGSLGFRLFIFPGAVALWPILAWKWFQANRGPR